MADKLQAMENFYKSIIEKAMHGKNYTDDMIDISYASKTNTLTVKFKNNNESCISDCYYNAPQSYTKLVKSVKPSHDQLIKKPIQYIKEYCTKNKIKLELTEETK